MRCKMNKFTLLEAPYRLYPPNNIGPTATPEQSCVETTADAKYGCEVSYAFSRDFRQRYDNCLTYSPRVCDAADDDGRMAKPTSAGCDRVPQGREQDLTGKTGH
jgi:hypothetical protein